MESVDILLANVSSFPRSLISLSGSSLPWALLMLHVTIESVSQQAMQGWLLLLEIVVSSSAFGAGASRAREGSPETLGAFS